MEDNGEEHYNAPALDMNEGKMEYSKFGKVRLKICVAFLIQIYGIKFIINILLLKFQILMEK